jgi:hypothetical protein
LRWPCVALHKHLCQQFMRKLHVLSHIAKTRKQKIVVCARWAITRWLLWRRSSLSPAGNISAISFPSQANILN